MQMFGVGPLEMMVILIIAVIIVGPERLPQVAGDLARWVARARAYANHLTRDFNEVVSELEKEVGASRNDWKEISDEITGAAKTVTEDIEATSKELQSMDLEAVKRDPAPAAVGSAAGANDNGSATTADTADETPAEDSEAATDGQPAENGERPWYATGRTSRRRSRE